MTDRAAGQALFAQTPKPRALCPACEPDVDPIAEFVYIEPCGTHNGSHGIPCEADEDVSTSGEYLPGTAESQMAVNRAVQAVIR
jgi:hypothetical protein